MSIKIRRLNIPNELKDHLAKKEIRFCKDVLSRSSAELLRVCDCSYSQIKMVQNACSEATLPSISNALSMTKTSAANLSPVNYLPTSLSSLDKLLHGGLPHGTITEITGPSGCGKTQFCLMLSALVSSHSDGGTVYIDTEGAFSAHRLLEIFKAKFPDMDTFLLENALKRVHVIQAHTCSSLMKCIQTIEEVIISQGIKLVLIDSVASLMRKEFSSASLSIIERTKLLTNLAGTLKYTATFFRIPVVATNQITTQFRRHDWDTSFQKDTSHVIGEEMVESGGGQGDQLIAALGNTWSHSVNTRLILQFLPEGLRQIKIAKSPVAAFGSVTYTIERQGLVQSGTEAVLYTGTDPSLQTVLSKGLYPSIPN